MKVTPLAISFCLCCSATLAQELPIFEINAESVGLAGNRSKLDLSSGARYGRHCYIGRKPRCVTGPMAAIKETCRCYLGHGVYTYGVVGE